VESGELSIGKVGECDVESKHLQCCSPRLCPLWTYRLAPVSKYWMYWSRTEDMGPISLVAGCQQKLIFFPLLQWLLWERSWIRTHGPVSRRAVDWVGSPSSREQWIYSNLLMTTRKVAMCWQCEIHMIGNHTRNERGMRVAWWSSFPLQDVYRFESPQLLDMSNCLFVTVFT
jgi:hypothetical protein